MADKYFLYRASYFTADGDAVNPSQGFVIDVSYENAKHQIANLPWPPGAKYALLSEAEHGLFSKEGTS